MSKRFSLPGLRPAFTLVEVLLALVVSSLVLLGLAYLGRVNHGRVGSLQSSHFQMAFQQLQDQHYELSACHHDRLELKKPGKSGQRILKEYHQQLVLEGQQHGRMILLEGLHDLSFFNHGHYQEVQAKNAQQERIKAVLFLFPKVNQGEENE
ncbi:prepilin-type N-terminal cleavage/methylation domain-containing protein [Fructobacillus parabroussonetiae]|uniref:Prepilin-type N-terminal cleavage/methylation domain-containing protein n=1 Tax=Fructobacillus parabroussonetiae TaxID=2713174 RepID=A0ABS5QXQ7_9LACO|nr:prepilin-type N-terminal cleavage/methylation domain-containing protein [Fructobacillus parabroussonetiae]MBS9337975.1 prepilin-type N-terminal cleavage/methylation domain-containing protein [Fructobacillus parabroussonetiae]